ncbi:MAG: lysylphosphatidylglycerol synthase domain-containing protein [Acidimicrobiales bacterium]
MAVPRAPAEVAMGRHPRDVARIVLSALLVTAGFFVARSHRVDPLEAGIYRDLALLPSWLDETSRAISLAGSVVGIAGAAGIALLVRRIRAALKLIVAGTAGWLACHFLSVFAPRRAVVVNGVPNGNGATHSVVLHSVFPSDHTAVAAALATVVTPYLPRSMRLVPLIGVALVAAAQDFTGGHLALELAAGAFIGFAIGSGLHLVWGAPGRATSTDAVTAVLRRSGLEVMRVEPIGRAGFGPRHFEARTGEGQCFVVEVVRRGQRRAGWAYKARRLLASLEVEDEPGLSSPSHEVDHEAFVTLLAERAGVRTPEVVFGLEMGHGPALLVRRKVEGCRLASLGAEAVDDCLLEQIWGQVRALGTARIAHHELTANNVLVDPSGAPWLLDFTFAKAGATDRRLAQDRAEMLVSLASVVGVERAVGSALRGSDREDLLPALSFLQPLALPVHIRRQLAPQTARQRLALGDISSRLAENLDAPRPSFRPRIRATTVLSLVVGGGAVYLLLPQIGTVPRLLDAMRQANYWWLIAAFGAGAVTFPMAAASYLGAVRRRLSLARTTLTQIASAFTSRLTPGGLGGMGLNLIYLERSGSPRAEAVGSIALNQAAGVVVHATGFFLAAAILGTSGLVGKAPLPSGWPFLAGVAGALIVAGVLVGSPLGRRRVLVPGLRVGRELVATLGHPLRALALFGGSAGVTLGNGLALVASLAAFDPHFSLVSVLAVYVGGAALASAAPTPGNLGALEAALVAGLTGIGVHPESAVAAVLTFRLLTFWLPILPGLGVLRYLQFRQIV